MLGLRKAFCWGAEPFFSHCLKMSGSVTSSSTAGLDDGLNPLGFSNLAEFDDEEQRLLSELQDECLCRVGLSLSLCLSLCLSLSLSLPLSPLCSLLVSVSLFLLIPRKELERSLDTEDNVSSPSFQPS